jgi:hypothetical protein
MITPNRSLKLYKEEWREVKIIKNKPGNKPGFV